MFLQGICRERHFVLQHFHKHRLVKHFAMIAANTGASLRNVSLRRSVCLNQLEIKCLFIEIYSNTYNIGCLRISKGQSKIITSKRGRCSSTKIKFFVSFFFFIISTTVVTNINQANSGCHMVPSPCRFQQYSLFLFGK